MCWLQISQARRLDLPLFASSHLLIASVEQLMEKEEEEAGGWGHLSESLLRADRGTMTTSG